MENKIWHETIEDLPKAISDNQVKEIEKYYTLNSMQINYYLYNKLNEELKRTLQFGNTDLCAFENYLKYNCSNSMLYPLFLLGKLAGQVETLDEERFNGII